MWPEVWEKLGKRDPSLDTFEDKLLRLTSSVESRIYRADIDGRHRTKYILGLNTPGGKVFHEISCRTIHVMEVINDRNPPCFFCVNRGKLRGQLHQLHS